jgi:predicted Ser/Thr protein kinase
VQLFSISRQSVPEGTGAILDVSGSGFVTGPGIATRCGFFHDTSAANEVVTFSVSTENAGSCASPFNLLPGTHKFRLSFDGGSTWTTEFQTFTVVATTTGTTGNPTTNQANAVTTGSVSGATTGSTTAGLTTGTTGVPQLATSGQVTSSVTTTPTTAPFTIAGGKSTDAGSSSSSPLVVIVVIVLCVVCLFVVIAALLWYRSRNRRDRGLASSSETVGSTSQSGSGTYVDMDSMVRDSSAVYEQFAPFAPSTANGGAYASVSGVHAAAAAEVALEKPEELVRGEELGRGAYGVVFKGTYNGQEVAIKHLLENYGDKEMIDFVAEADLMKCLPDHPNVVGFLGLVTLADINAPALVVEFCPGNSLELYLEERGPLGSATQPILLGICRGMQALAAAGITHRDLATRNILLSGRGKDISGLTPKVADFGEGRFSQQESNTTKSNTGPVRYMAPEALTERKVCLLCSSACFLFLPFR